MNLSTSLSIYISHHRNIFSKSFVKNLQTLHQKSMESQTDLQGLSSDPLYIIFFYDKDAQLMLDQYHAYLGGFLKSKSFSQDAFAALIQELKSSLDTVDNVILYMDINLGEPGISIMTEHAKILIDMINPCYLTLFSATPEALEQASLWAKDHGDQIKILDAPQEHLESKKNSFIELSIIDSKDLRKSISTNFDSMLSLSNQSVKMHSTDATPINSWCHGDSDYGFFASVDEESPTSTSKKKDNVDDISDLKSGS